jgi:toxin ParE1/3/4
MDKFRLTQEAQADLDDIGRYTQRHWGVPQRTAYLTLLDDAFQRIAANPYLGRARHDIRPEVRSYVCKQQVILYRLISQGVEILRVLHHARDIGKAF